MMKRWACLLLLLLGLVACGGDRVTPADASPFQMMIASSDLAPGPSRLVLTFWDGPERLRGVQEMEVTIFSLDEQNSISETVWSGSAQRYQMEELEYWVSFPNFPAPGYYGAQALIRTAEGTRVENRALLEVKAEAEAPSIGEAVPPSQTRTLADAPLEELSSAPPYVEHFYQMTVAEAAASGKPSIIVFSTPGHCTSALCGPVLNAVAQVDEEVPGALNVVHVEIYRDFDSQTVDPAVTEWKLPSEPWVFVLNADGTVAARLDGLVGPEELREAVEQVQGS